jgi:hypothetical protein
MRRTVQITFPQILFVLTVATKVCKQKPWAAGPTTATVVLSFREPSLSFISRKQSSIHYW